MKNILKNNLIDIWKKEIKKDLSIYSLREFNFLISFSNKNLSILFDCAKYDYNCGYLTIKEENTAKLFLELYKKYYE